jgi:hypothetical protein
MRAFARLVSFLPKLPDTLAVDQIEVRDTLIDLAEEAKLLGTVSLEVIDPLKEERDTALEANRRNLESLLAGKAQEPSEGPKVEVWQIPFSLKSLLQAVLPEKEPEPGKSFLFFFSRL